MSMLATLTQRKSLLRLAVPLACTALLVACSKAPEEEAPIRPVRMMVIADAGSNPSMMLAGEVRARVESNLGFRVAGKVNARLVELGQRVQKGQVLARLDPSNEALTLQAAQARLNSAIAERDLAKTEFQRFDELHKQKYVSDIEMDRRRITLKNTESMVEQAQADMNLAGNRVDYAVLVADANGVISGVMADVGEVVGVGQPVVSLAHDGARDVVVSVPEDRLAAVRAAKAVVSMWANASARYPAQLRELAAVADPVSRTFTARYTFTGAADLGQTATVNLNVPGGANGFRVPSSAVMKFNDGMGVWVFDEKTSTMKRRAIQVVGIDGNDAIIAGVNPGEQIATAGVHVLEEGIKIRPYESSVLANKK